MAMAVVVMDMDMVTDMAGVIHATDMDMVTDMAGVTRAGVTTLLITLDITLLIILDIMNDPHMVKDMLTILEGLMVEATG